MSSTYLGQIRKGLSLSYDRLPENMARAALTSTSISGIASACISQLVSQPRRLSFAYAISAIFTSAIESALTPSAYLFVRLIKGKSDTDLFDPDTCITAKEKIVVQMVRRIATLVIGHFALVPLLGLEINIPFHLLLFSMQVGIEHYFRTNAVKSIPFTILAPFEKLLLRS